jgi:hypothetical protein
LRFRAQSLGWKLRKEIPPLAKSSVSQTKKRQTLTRLRVTDYLMRVAQQING